MKSKARPFRGERSGRPIVSVADLVTNAVAAALRRAQGDLDAAEAYLVDQAASDPDLSRELTRRGAVDSIARALANCRRIDRRRAPSNPTVAVVRQAAIARGAEILASVYSGWYGLPLAGGLRLGDATRSDLERQSGIHRALAQANSAKERFFRRLSAAMPNGEARVRDVLSEERIAELSEDEAAA